MPNKANDMLAARGWQPALDVHLVGLTREAQVYDRLFSISPDTVILAHGYSSRATHTSDSARFYHEQRGFNVLLPDMRGRPHRPARRSR